ncbi:MAG: hypothetical protein ACKV2O_03195 [Acidimicrobiales bacterium]
MIDLELCLVEDPTETDGPLMALSLGGQEALVVSISPPGRRQRYGERLTLQSRLPDEGLACYTAGDTVHTGGYEAHRLLVPHPGQAALLRLQRQIEERGWALAVHGVDAPAGRSSGLIELWLATPTGGEGASAVELDAMLGAVTHDWTYPPAYPELVVRAGGNITEHLRRTDQYGKIRLQPSEDGNS